MNPRAQRRVKRAEILLREQSQISFSRAGALKLYCTRISCDTNFAREHTSRLQTPPRIAHDMYSISNLNGSSRPITPHQKFKHQLTVRAPLA